MNALVAALALAGAVSAGQRIELHDGWAIHSARGLGDGGAALSTAGHATRGWLPARVPTTVLAAQVARGDYPDPGYGLNLRAIPGANDYPVGGNFSHYPMSDANPYHDAWWYRVELEVPAGPERVWLCFDGINYRANIWLNGHLIAGEKDVAGAYRRYAFDVTAEVKRGQRNALAVEVFAPGKNDLAPSFIDWNPAPPDRNLGLWQDVYLVLSGPVRLTQPFVTAHVPSPAEARLGVGAELVNRGATPVTAVITGVISEAGGRGASSGANGPGANGARRFSETITLAPHETRPLALDAERHPELVMAKPALWWPYQLGPHPLHDLELTVSVGGVVSDRVRTRFGIREIKLDFVDGQWARYSINGKPLLIRGAGYTSDFLLRFSDARDEAEMGLVKDLGLNTIRIEGKLADDHLFDIADREGILVMPGWECCSAWEYWNEDQTKHGVAPWSEATRAIAVASLDSQLRRLRGHPSVITFLYGSDSRPPPEVERLYLAAARAARWPLPTQNQASERDPSPLTGPSGFKMSGPYDYVPPAYWYAKQHGGAFGFNSETGPGAAVPNVESLARMLPRDRLWPINDAWNYHLGGERFASLDIHTRALEARYGKARDLDDYARKAQALAYDSERAMFEAYRRNRGSATGVIAWMLNSAWPSMLWHLYDYYLAAGGGYYGAKKGNEPLHIQYSYDDRSVVVVNDGAAAVGGLRASAEVYDFDGRRVLRRERARLSAAADSSTVAATLPAPAAGHSAYFVRLALTDARGRLVSHGFYCLSAKPDVLDWEHTDWWGTPVREHADLSALGALPRQAPALDASLAATNDGSARVTLRNRGSGVALFLRLRVVRDAGGGHPGAELLPSTWSDNYISLIPGETRELSARFDAAALGDTRPLIVMTGWNVPETVTVPRRAEGEGGGHARAHDP